MLFLLQGKMLHLVLSLNPTLNNLQVYFHHTYGNKQKQSSYIKLSSAKFAIVLPAEAIQGCICAHEEHLRHLGICKWKVDNANMRFCVLPECVEQVCMDSCNSWVGMDAGWESPSLLMPTLVLMTMSLC